MNLREKKALLSEADKWTERIGFNCDGEFWTGVVSGVVIRKSGISVEVDTDNGAIILAPDAIENVFLPATC